MTVQNMVAQEHERKRRYLELLSRPSPRKVTKKFDATKRDKVPTVTKHKSAPITPSKRIELLAQPVRVTPKFTPLDECSSIDRAVLEFPCTARLDHLSKPTVRYLQAMKNDYQYKRKSFVDKFEEKIQISFDTIYYHNAKSEMHIKQEKERLRNKGKTVEKKPTGWDACGDRARLEIISKPKPKRKPSPPRKRKWIPLAKLKSRINKLAIPNNVYIRPSKDSFMLEQKSRLQEAQNYKISERVKELGKIPEWRLIKPVIPPMVTRAALNYKISDRMNELAHPHARHKAVDGDLKENAFEISKNALKYKPSPRMIELAKPVER